MPIVRPLGGIALLLVTPIIAAAQPAGPVSPVRHTLVEALLEDPNLPRDVALPDATGVPAVPPRVADLDPTAPPPAASPGLLRQFKLDQTYLPKTGGSDGFGIHDTELSAAVALPWEPLGKPLLLKGGFGIHLWDGPSRAADGTDPGLPGSVYDLYLDLGWRPRLAEWLFADLGVTPGLYTDFHAFPSEAFRLRGRGLAIVALSEKFQFVAGVLYVNRNETKLIPAGGFLYSPDDATTYQIVFPQPKAARRFATFGDKQWWGYVAGEFGGGTWAYRRPDGGDGSLDYNDYRVIVGSELRRADGWSLKAEAGYVFGREVVPLNAARVDPGDTVMLRVGLNY